MTTVHLIYAHAKHNSYNAALKDTLTTQLKKAGHTVIISDLYADAPQLQTFYGHELSAEQQNYIKAEQAKIKSARFTVVQFPMYWFSFPAILKNYFDLVYAHGFAYPGRFAESPLNDGRQVMLSITTQSTKEDFSDSGCNGNIEKILYPMELAFKFVGYKIAPAEVYYAVGSTTNEERQQQMLHFNDKVISTIEKI